MIEFRITDHSRLPNVRIVEILDSGKVVGIIYPTQKGLKLVSAHMVHAEIDPGFAGEAIIDDGTKTFPPIPAVIVEFHSTPYMIVGGKIFKIVPN